MFSPPELQRARSDEAVAYRTNTGTSAADRALNPGPQVKRIPLREKKREREEKQTPQGTFEVSMEG